MSHDKDGLKDLALETLAAICRSEDSPSNARASASRTLLEALRVIGSKADTAVTEKSADQMTLEEIDREIAELDIMLALNPVTGKRLN